MRLFLVLSCALAVAWPAAAAIPTAAELLPPETLALFSVPDWQKATEYWKSSPQGRLWQDPSMSRFREKITQHWNEEFAARLERDLGVKLADYLELLRGQVTVAITQNEWGARPDAQPGIIVLIDTKDKQDLLKTRLADLRKKWIDAGKQLKTEKVRDVDLTTFIIADSALSRTLKSALPGSGEDDPGDEAPEDEAEKKPARTEITFGQSGALLLVGNTFKDFERILARQSGGTAPALSEQAVYQAQHARGALGFGWINFARVYEGFEKQFKSSKKSAFGGNRRAPRTDRVLAATGLGGVKSIAAKLTGDNEGASAEIFVAAPAAQRQGLLRLFQTDRKEAGPAAFVGADVVKFSRWRVDGQKAWSTLEALLTSVSPELSGLLQMGLQAAGKDKDPNFDLRKTLVGNLGDDFISLQKAPRTLTLADLTTPPALLLIGSPNAEQLVQGLKAATSLMPMAGGEPTINEREFLGRKIYSLALAPLADGDEPKNAGPSSRSFSFAASGGYAALSADSGSLEEYLRSAEGSGRSLRELPGLAEAAQKVGGMSTGLFGYQNQAEAARIWLESAKKQQAALEKLLSMAPLADAKEGDEDAKKESEWIDVSLLPPFERIAKYFHFFVYAVSSSEEGLGWRLFAPVPPRLN